MSANGLLVYGQLRKQFLQAVNRSALLKSLWSQQTAQSVNVPSTLPLHMLLKLEIYLQVAENNKGKSSVEVKARQGFAYAKQLMIFYKHGVSAVWKNQKKVRALKNLSFQVPGSLDRTGREVAIKISGPRPLTKFLAQQLYMNLMENTAEMNATRGDVVKAGVVTEPSYSENLFKMSRADFQLLRRTPPDFLKIPLFAVIFTIFMEMTPVLCYAFPEVTPLTCVLPLLLPRIWRTQPMKQLESNTTQAEIGLVEDYLMKTAYNLPAEHVRLLCTSLRLKTKYIPTLLFPEFVLRQRLHDYFNYLSVDNYYLSGLNGDGNVWNLDTQELVLACLERNLVNDCKALVEKLSTGPLGERTEALDELRFKLLRFVADFRSTNVGYLGVAHLLEKPDVMAIQKWRQETEKK